MAQTNNRRTQDRTERGMNRGTERSTRPFKMIYGVGRSGRAALLTRIGVAFVNQDGSINCLFNFLPADPDTTIVG
jgi:hypothetical protein